MNVTGMIKRLKGQFYTVTRASADGAYSGTDGTFQPGATVTLSIMGSVQPMTPDDLVSIPEGDRTKERFRFYSFPALQNNQTAALRKGDDVAVNGVAYRVESIEHWPNYGKAIIARVNTDAS